MPLLLERELRSRGFDSEVLNFGMSGYGTDQDYLLVKSQVLAYRPDVVVLSFFYSNDFWNNGERISSGREKPVFRVAGDALELLPLPRGASEARGAEAAKVPPGSFLGRARQALETRSFIYNVVTRGPLGRDVDDTGASALGMQRTITKRLILMMRQEVEASGAAFFVFIYPGFGYYHGERTEYLETASFFRRELPDVQLVDLTPRFDDVEGPLYYTFSEHWNAAGSRLTAILLADQLARDFADRLGKREVAADP
jgi:hypothetical protein